MSAKYEEGQFLILAHPTTLKHLKGEEVEVIKVERPYVEHDKLIQSYVIFIHRLKEVYTAEEAALKPLDPPDTPSNWKYSPWKPKLKLE